MNLSRGNIYPNLSVISKYGPNKHFLGTKGWGLKEKNILKELSLRGK